MDPLAERQAAHRTRQETERNKLLAALYRLDTAMWEAGDRGDTLALACRTSSLESMLGRLATLFEN